MHWFERVELEQASDIRDALLCCPLSSLTILFERGQNNPMSLEILNNGMNRRIRSVVVIDITFI